MKNRLWSEVFLRSKTSVIGQLAVVVLDLILIRGDLGPSQTKHPKILAYLMAIGVLACARWVISYLESEARAVRMALVAVVLTGGLSWGLLTSEGINTFGLRDIRSLIFLMSACAIVAGAASSLGPVLRLYAAFSSGIFIPVLYTVFFFQGAEHSFVLFLAALTFFGFLMIQGRYQHSLITRGMKQEFLLAQEKERLEAVLGAIPGLVVMVDQKLNYMECSQHDSDEYEGRALIGKKLGFKGQDTEFVKLVSQFVQERKESLSVEIQGTEVLRDRFQKMDLRAYIPAEKRWFLLSMRKTHIPYEGAVLIFSPIDELKTARTELERQKARSQFSARLSTLGEMAGGIAHEINNPLAVISAAAETIKEEMTLPELNKELIKRMLSQIEKVANRIAKIVKGLKAFSRQGDRDPFQKTLLQTIVQDSLDLCQKKFANGGVTLEVSPIPEVEIECRPVQVSQILLNILGNAYDAIHGKFEQPWVKLEIIKTEDSIEIQVTDSGPGIPPGVREKIFEPFFTTKELGKGTGLGLSISMGIVQDHGGTLTIDDRCSNTCFIVRLPIAQKVKAPNPIVIEEKSDEMNQLFEAMVREISDTPQNDDEGGDSSAA